MSIVLPRFELSDGLPLRATTLLNQSQEQIETQELGQDALLAAFQVALQEIIDAQAAADAAQADANAAAVDAAAAQTTADGKQAASAVLTFLATASDATAAAVKTLLALVKADVGLGSADDTADADKPVSTAQAAALALKAPLASPTFTGTVRIDNTPAASTATVTHTIPINLNGTTYYMLVSNVP